MQHVRVSDGRATYRALWIAGRGIEVTFVAEDLGTITDDVRELRRDLGLPGMQVLQFGFEEADDAAYESVRTMWHLVGGAAGQQP